jgi:hypothetical protein
MRTITPQKANIKTTKAIEEEKASNMQKKSINEEDVSMTMASKKPLTPSLTKKRPKTANREPQV